MVNVVGKLGQNNWKSTEKKENQPVCRRSSAWRHDAKRRHLSSSFVDAPSIRAPVGIGTHDNAFPGTWFCPRAFFQASLGEIGVSDLSGLGLLSLMPTFKSKRR